MRDTLVVTITILFLGSFSSLALSTAEADPWTIDNGNGMSTAI